MRVLGLDIGSRSVDAVWLEGGCVVAVEIVDSGYGRHAAREMFDCPVVTEIKAYAVGASRLFPDAVSVLDIGGQDTKVIALGANGKVTDFEMNDKCAAGTGKFLEVMARALGFELEEMAAASMASKRGVQISSMCTVFAESEVTGLVHRAAGPLVFAGGVAKNAAMVELICSGFEGEVRIPEEAQTVGALGAALSLNGDSAQALQ